MHSEAAVERHLDRVRRRERARDLRRRYGICAALCFVNASLFTGYWLAEPWERELPGWLAALSALSAGAFCAASLCNR